jgi:S1-C subfamily serine protease
VVYEAQRGLIVTNNYVLENANDITVMLTDGRKLKAKRVGGDPDFDLAVISVPAEKLTAIPFGDSRQLEVGGISCSPSAIPRTLAMIRELKMSAPQGGAVLVKVDPKSPGARAGLKSVQGQIVDGDAERATADFAGIHDLSGDDARYVDRNRKAHVGIGAGRADEGGIDTDQVALQIDLRAAGVPGIDRRVGLDEVLELLDADVRPVQAADDP